MTMFAQIIHQVATDSAFRCQIQNNAVLDAGLSHEEIKALDSLRHLLRLSTEELQHVLAENDLLAGWFPAAVEPVTVTP